MATTSIITATTAADTSDDFDVEAGTPVTVSIQAPPGNIGSNVLYIDKKTSEGNYVIVGRMDLVEPSKQIVGAGTYRVRKKASEYEIGADRD